MNLRLEKPENRDQGPKGDIHKDSLVNFTDVLQSSPKNLAAQDVAKNGLLSFNGMSNNDVFERNLPAFQLVGDVPIRRIPEGVSGLAEKETKPKPVRLLPPHMLPGSGGFHVLPQIEALEDDD